MNLQVDGLKILKVAQMSTNIRQRGDSGFEFFSLTKIWEI